MSMQQAAKAAVARALQDASTFDAVSGGARLDTARPVPNTGTKEDFAGMNFLWEHPTRGKNWGSGRATYTEDAMNVHYYIGPRTVEDIRFAMLPFIEDPAFQRQFSWAPLNVISDIGGHLKIDVGISTPGTGPLSYTIDVHPGGEDRYDIPPFVTLSMNTVPTKY
jgi:hypothetical protein